MPAPFAARAPKARAGGPVSEPNGRPVPRTPFDRGPSGGPRPDPPGSHAWPGAEMSATGQRASDHPGTHDHVSRAQAAPPPPLCVAFRKQGRNVTLPVHHRNHPRAGGLCRKVRAVPPPAQLVLDLKQAIPFLSEA